MKTKQLLPITCLILLTLMSSYILNTHGSEDIKEKSEEEKLLEHLFQSRRHFHGVLPKLKYIDPEGALAISFNFTIYHVYYITASEEEIGMTMKIYMSWKNELLKWDARQFGINHIFVQAHQVWTPTLVVEENTLRMSIVAGVNETVHLHADGLNTVVFFQKVAIKCEQKACLFPMDIQDDCTITFIVKSYNASIVTINPVVLKPPQRQSRGTGTWTINVGKANNTLTAQAGISDELNSGIKYKIQVARRSLYFITTTIIPMSLLSIISATAAILPAMTGDRIALLITCFLATIVYLDTLFRYLPESSTTVPIIITWTVLNLVFMTLQIVLASVCLNWTYKEEKKKKLSKKAAFIIFYVIKWTIMFLPWTMKKLKNCVEERQKCKRTTVMVTDINNDQTATTTTEAGIVTENQSDSKRVSLSSDKEEETMKSFKNAIKIIDSFALLFSLTTLGILVMGTLFIIRGKQAAICEFGKDW